MQAPIFPPNESDRLRALEELEILDSATEGIFDDLVGLASMICETPISLISLVDSNRQWFKAKVGLDAVSTPREISFCGHALNETQLFEVPDAAQDARFVDNPLVTGAPNIRFYAGAQLRTNDGQCIGALCVIDRVARKLSERQKSALLALARQIDFSLHERKTRREILRRDQELSEAYENSRLQNLQYEALMENMSEGLVQQDRAGAILSFNGSALRILGQTADQLQGRTSLDPSWRAIREDGSDFAAEDCPAMTSLRTGKPTSNVVMGLSLPSGERRWLSINSTPILSSVDARPESVITTFSDITSEREKTVQLLQAAKLSSLGVMAGGIAHEINTPLATIKTKIDLLRARAEADDENLEHRKDQYDKISKTVDRISKIVRAMRTIARDADRDAVSIVNVAQLAADAVALCHDRLVAEGIELRLELQDAEISCRPGEIGQVLLNLIGNSIDAVANAENRWIEIRAHADAKILTVSVTDSGPGISSDAASRMMDPFFTTKPVGKGTGLGLSISRSIVEAHGGRLFLDLRSPRTRMSFELPTEAMDENGPNAAAEKK